MSTREQGRKWDGKSRVSNETYRKRWDEIFKKKEKDEWWKNMDKPKEVEDDE